MCSVFHSKSEYFPSHLRALYTYVGTDDTFAGVPGHNPSPNDVTNTASSVYEIDLIPLHAVRRAIMASARSFWAQCKAGEISESEVITLSFSALRSLDELVTGSLSTSVTVTNGIQVINLMTQTLNCSSLSPIKTGILLLSIEEMFRMSITTSLISLNTRWRS